MGIVDDGFTDCGCFIYGFHLYVGVVDDEPVGSRPIVEGSICRWVPSDLKVVYWTMMVSG